MPHNQNTVCVQYRLLRGDAIDVQVRPFVSFRRHDESPAETPGEAFMLDVRRGRHEIRHTGSPLTLRLGLRPGPTTFVTEERDEHQFMYRIERDRGDPAFESAFSPGYFMARVERRAAGRVRRLDARLGAARLRRHFGLRRRTSPPRRTC